MRHGTDQTVRRRQGEADNGAARTMTIGALVAQLRKLDQTAEVALISASGMARPPTIERVCEGAWSMYDKTARFGLSKPDNAYLIRPAQEII